MDLSILTNVSSKKKIDSYLSISNYIDEKTTNVLFFGPVKPDTDYLGQKYPDVGFTYISFLNRDFKVLSRLIRSTGRCIILEDSSTSNFLTNLNELSGYLDRKPPVVKL